jgi:putative ABC transport system substrate-binding protein
MERRRFVEVIAGGLLAAPLAAEAQRAEKSPRVGVLFMSTREGAAPFIQALERGLQERGYVDGRNLTIEYRFARNKPEQVPVLAAELAAVNVDVLVVGVDRIAMAARPAMRKTPIVMAVAEDPVGVGLVQSIAHPGGDITGVTVVPGSEIFGKNLQLLAETLPRGAPIAVLFNTESRINSVYLKATEDAARKLGVTLVPAGVRSDKEFDSAFRLIKQRRARGVIVLGENLFYTNRARLHDLAIRNGLAALWPCRECVEQGGLMAYGVNVANLYERAATYIDKILNGAKPGDLPMEQPTKYELVINLKTAKALGLTIPQSLLQRADEMIQ